MPVCCLSDGSRLLDLPRRSFERRRSWRVRVCAIVTWNDRASLMRLQLQQQQARDKPAIHVPE